MVDGCGGDNDDNNATVNDMRNTPSILDDTGWRASLRPCYPRENSEALTEPQPQPARRAHTHLPPLRAAIARSRVIYTPARRISHRGWF